MTYIKIMETLILSNKKKEEQSFLEEEFPYKSSYELMNIAIINAAKEGKKSIYFDFVDNDLKNIGSTTLDIIEKKYRNIYPSYDSFTHALEDTYSYPRYLAARGFNIKIVDALKMHGYVSKAYHISWENY